MSMKTLETGQEKIQKICDVLRRDTLEPAKEEAQGIIIEAKKRAEHIIVEAQQQAEKFLEQARHAIEQERNVFQSSLTQSAKQSLEALRQSIEYNLFNKELHHLVVRHTADPKVIAKLIESLVKALEKEGLAVDLAAIIPASVSSKEVNTLLTAEILSKLQGNSVVLGDIAGGVKILIKNKRMELDISNTEIEELLQRYLRKDFRKMIFNE